MLLLTMRRPVPPARLPRLRVCARSRMPRIHLPLPSHSGRSRLSAVGSTRHIWTCSWRPLSLNCCRMLATDPISRRLVRRSHAVVFFAPGGRPLVRLVRVERSGRRAGVDRRGRMAACPHVHDVRYPYGRANRPAYGGVLARAFACLGRHAHRSAAPCDGIHVGSVMMRRRGLLVVTYRPVGTSTLDARSTGGFPVRGE